MTAISREYRFRVWRQNPYESQATPSTLGEFMFRDGEGSTVTDETGTADATIVTPGSGWRPGPMGGAYAVDAVADIKATHATGFDIGTGQDVTLEAVCRIDATGGKDYYLLQHPNDYALLWNITGWPCIWLRDYNGITALTTVTFSSLGLLGRFHHLRITYDASAPLVYFYVDGELLGTKVPTGSPNASAISDDLYLGRFGPSGAIADCWLAYARVSSTLETDLPHIAHEFRHELEEPPAVPGDVARPLEGRVDTAAWTVQLADLNGVVSKGLGDSSSKRLTWHGSQADIAWRERGATAWDFLATGRVKYVSENGRGGFQVQVESERTREREAQVLTETDTVSFIPAGLRYEFAGVPHTFIGTAEVLAIVDGGVSDYVLLRLGAHANSTTVLERIISDVSPEPYPGAYHGSNLDQGNFEHTRIYVDGAEREVVTFDTVFVPDPAEPLRSLKYPGKTFVDSLERMRSDESLTRIVWCWVPTGQTGDWATSPPSVGEIFYDCRVYPVNMAPSPEFPLHLGVKGTAHRFGTTAGGIHPFELLRRLYDQEGILYHRGAMNALIGDPRYPVGEWRVTEVPSNLAEWAEDYIYQPYQVLPFVDEFGQIKPASVALPDGNSYSAAALKKFTPADMAGGSPTWESPGNELRNVVRVKFQQLKLPPAGWLGFMHHILGPVGEMPIDFIRADELVREVKHDNVLALGRHELEVLLGGIHDVGQVAAFLQRYAADVFSRFGDGPIRGSIDALSMHYGKTAGEWVLVEDPTYPNPDSATGRGGSRLVQLVSRTFDPAGPGFRILDGGPDAQPLPTPTITSVVNDTTTPKHVQVVSWSGLPTANDVAYAELERAESATEPAADSPLWLLYIAWEAPKGSATTGSFNGFRLKSGTKYYWHMRVGRPGRVRSAWSTAVAQTTQAMTAPSSVTFSDVQANQFTVNWTNGENTYHVEVLLGSDLIARLEPGSVSTVVKGLDASTSYTVYVRHRDLYGGVSTSASNSQTTGSSTTKWPTPGAILILDPDNLRIPAIQGGPA